MLEFKKEIYKTEFFSDKIRHDLRMMVVIFAARVEGRFNKNLIVTSVLPEQGIERRSDSHKEGRAVDVRTKDWSAKMVVDSQSWLVANFKTGVDFKDGREMLPCHYHNSGYGAHFHLQVASNNRLTINIGGEIKNIDTL